MYMAANEELPKVKASDIYVLNNTPKPSLPKNDPREYTAVDRTRARINLLIFSLELKVASKRYMNNPKFIKYQSPLVLVAMDQNEVCKLRPNTADITKAKRY